MFRYVIFSVALVIACAREGPSPPIENELTLLAKLMNDIEARINATAEAQVNSVINATMACWNLNLSGYMEQIESKYQSGLAPFEADLRTKSQEADSMTQEQLDHLQELLISSGADGLMKRLGNLLKDLQTTVANVTETMSTADLFSCT